MRAMIAMIILGCAVSAHAAPGPTQVYKWTDDRGTVNYSDDLGNVPEKYRKRAILVGGEEPVAPEIIELDRPAKPAEKKGAGAEAPEKGGDKGKKVETYGDKDAKSWKREFTQLRNEIKTTESHLADLKGRLSDTSKMSRGEYLGLQNSVKFAESKLEELQKKMEALNESADRASVPANLRSESK